MEHPSLKPSSNCIKPRISSEEYQAEIPDLQQPKKNSSKSRRSRKKVDDGPIVRDLRPGQMDVKDGLIWSPIHDVKKEEELDRYLLFARTLTGGCYPSPNHSDEPIEPFLEHLTRHGLLTHHAQAQARASLLWTVGSGKEVALLDYYSAGNDELPSSKEEGEEGNDDERSCKRSRKDSQLGSEDEDESNCAQDGGGQEAKELVKWKSYFSPQPEILGCLPPAGGYGPPTARLNRMKKTPRSLGERALKRQWDDLVREIEAVLLLTPSATSHSKQNAGGGNRRSTVSVTGNSARGKSSRLPDLLTLLGKAQSLPGPQHLIDETLEERVEAACSQLARAVAAGERWIARCRDLLSPFNSVLHLHGSGEGGVVGPGSLFGRPYPSASSTAGSPALQPTSPPQPFVISPLLTGGYPSPIGMPSLVLGSAGPGDASGTTKSLVTELTKLLEEADVLPIAIDETEHLRHLLQQVSNYCGKVEDFVSRVTASRKHNAQVLEQAGGRGALVPHKPPRKRQEPQAPGQVQVAELTALLEESLLIPAALLQGTHRPLQELCQEVEAMRLRIDRFFLQPVQVRPVMPQALQLYSDAFSLGLNFPSKDRLAAAIAKATNWKQQAEGLETKKEVELRLLETTLKVGQGLVVAAGPLLGQLKVRVEAGREWLRRARKALSLNHDSPNTTKTAKISIEKVENLLEEGKSTVWYTPEYKGLSDLMANAHDWMEQVHTATSTNGGKRSSSVGKAKGTSSSERLACLQVLARKEQQMGVELSLLSESKKLADAIKGMEWCVECRARLDSRTLTLTELKTLLEKAKSLKSSNQGARSGNLGQEEDEASRVYQQGTAVCDKARKLVRRVKKEGGSVPYSQLKKLADESHSSPLNLENEMASLKALVVPVEAYLVAYEDVFNCCGIKIVSTVITKSELSSPKPSKRHSDSKPATSKKVTMANLQECLEAGEDLEMDIPEVNELVALDKSVKEWTNRVSQWRYKQKAVRRTGGAAKKPTLDVMRTLLKEGQEFPVDVADQEMKLNEQMEEIFQWQREAAERLLQLVEKMKECGRKRVSLWVRKWDEIKALVSRKKSTPGGGHDLPLLESDASCSSLLSDLEREREMHQAKARDARAKTRRKELSHQDVGPEKTEEDGTSTSSGDDEVSDEEYRLDKSASDGLWDLEQLVEEARMQPVASQEEEWVEAAFDVGQWVRQTVECLGHPKAVTTASHSPGAGLTSTDLKRLLDEQPALDSTCLRANRALANLLRKVCKIYGDYMVGFLEGLAAAEDWVATARRALAQESTSLTDLENLLVGARKGQFVASAEVRRVRFDLERSVAWYGRARTALKQKRPLGEVTKLLHDAERMKLHCDEQKKLRRAASQAKAWLAKVKKSGVETGKASVEELRQLVSETDGIVGVDLTEEKKVLQDAASSYCLCRTPQEEGAMVKCCRCPDQFHQGCVVDSPWASRVGPTSIGFVCLRCLLRDVFVAAAKRVGSAVRKNLGEPPPEETHPKTAETPPVENSEGSDAESLDPGSWAIMAAMRTGIMSFQRSRSGSCGLEALAPNNKEKEDKPKPNPEPVPQFSQQNIKRWTLILVKVLGEPEETALAESKHFVCGRQGALLKQLSTKARQLQIAEAKCVRDCLESVKVMLWALRALWLFRHRPRLADLLRLVDAGTGLPFSDAVESHILQTFQTFVSKAKAWELEVKKFLAPGGKRDYDLSTLEELLDKARFLPVVTRQEEVTQEVIEDGGHRYCICKGPNDGSFMVQCDKCDSWYHGQCVNVNQDMEDELGNYECPACAKKRGKSYMFGHIDLMTPFRMDSQSDDEEDEDSDDEDTPEEDVVVAYSSLWPAFEIMGIDEKDFVAPTGKGRSKSGNMYTSNINGYGKRKTLEIMADETSAGGKRLRKTL